MATTEVPLDVVQQLADVNAPVLNTAFAPPATVSEEVITDPAVEFEKRPFLSEREKSFLLFPITAIAWLLAKPIQVFTWVIVKVKTHTYDPEKVICPACGFKGDSGTGGKSCWIRFMPTKEKERFAIQHICFRCGCDKYFSNLAKKADNWIPR
jgi:hypothetical protein